MSKTMAAPNQQAGPGPRSHRHHFRQVVNVLREAEGGTDNSNLAKVLNVSASSTASMVAELRRALLLEKAGSLHRTTRLGHLLSDAAHVANLVIDCKLPAGSVTDAVMWAREMLPKQASGRASVYDYVPIAESEKRTGKASYGVGRSELARIHDILRAMESKPATFQDLRKIARFSYEGYDTSELKGILDILRRNRMVDVGNRYDEFSPIWSNNAGRSFDSLLSGILAAMAPKQ